MRGREGGEEEGGEEEEEEGYTYCYYIESSEHISPSEQYSISFVSLYETLEPCTDGFSMCVVRSRQFARLCLCVLET